MFHVIRSNPFIHIYVSIFLILITLILPLLRTISTSFEQILASRWELIAFNYYIRIEKTRKQKHKINKYI